MVPDYVCPEMSQRSLRIAGGSCLILENERPLPSKRHSLFRVGGVGGAAIQKRDYVAKVGWVGL